MEIKSHFESIRYNISLGNIKEAIDKLQFLSNKSELLNEIILQQSRLSELNKIILRGTLKFEEESMTKNQIVQSILILTDELEREISSHKGIQMELGLSINEFIRKFGLHEDWLKMHFSRHGTRAFNCLWIDDNPENDKIEINVLSALNIQCSIAKNPYDAYKIMKEKSLDIIVINSLSRLRDNENEGLEFCEFLFRDNRYKNIPVIMHSISLQKRISKRECIKMPQNIKNDFAKKNALIIKDLVEEIIVNIWKKTPVVTSMPKTDW